MSKRHKFTEQEAIALMTTLHSDGVINGWSITKSGYVRYFETAAKVWRDFIQYDMVRWGNKALVN